MRKSTELIDYVDIGKRIQKKRKSLDITQEALADKTNLDTSTISKFETGNTKISLPSLVKIANILEMSADELLCGSIRASSYIYQNELIEQLQNCTEEEFRLLTAINTCLLKELRK